MASIDEPPKGIGKPSSSAEQPAPPAPTAALLELGAQVLQPRRRRSARPSRRRRARCAARRRGDRRALHVARHAPPARVGRVIKTADSDALAPVRHDGDACGARTPSPHTARPRAVHWPRRRARLRRAPDRGVTGCASARSRPGGLLFPFCPAATGEGLEY